MIPVSYGINFKAVFIAKECEMRGFAGINPVFQKFRYGKGLDNGSLVPAEQEFLL